MLRFINREQLTLQRWIYVIVFKLALKLEPGGTQSWREMKNGEGWPCSGSEYEKWWRRQNYLVVPPVYMEENTRQDNTKQQRFRKLSTERYICEKQKKLALFKMWVAAGSLPIILHISPNSIFMKIFYRFYCFYCYLYSVEEETEDNRYMTNRVNVVLLYIWKILEK